MDNKVGLIRVTEYETQTILSSLRKALIPFGGMGNFVKPNMKVLLKPNLLGPFSPDSAVVTHWTVLEAVAILVKETGAEVFVGDSPGCGTIKSVLSTSCLDKVIERQNLTWLDLEHGKEFTFPNNVIARRIKLAAAIDDIDVIINLPKVKTHVQMVYTGAMKNLYGLLPGSLKSEYHYRLQTREYLAELMVDLNVCNKVVLNIIDGIMAMEGEGPSGGVPRALNLIGISTSTVALDTVIADIINLKATQLPLLVAANKRNFGCSDISKIELCGEDISTFKVLDFKHIKSLSDPLKILPFPKKIREFISRNWKPLPHIDKTKCIKCMRCRDGCPVKPPAINPNKSYSANSSLCIKCYCCHEFCPVKAIDLKATFIEKYILTKKVQKFMSNLAGLFKRK